jgi:predicted PurR-regulated permease PerM
VPRVRSGGREDAATLPVDPAALPPAPFVIRDPAGGRLRFAPLSPRVAILIAALVVVGVLLWMARDAVRPFVVGLLIVYMLDAPVRYLARLGIPRALAILIVYIVVGFLLVEFLNLTLTPLVTEIRRFIEEFPQLTAQLEGQIGRLREVYAGLELPAALREWLDSALSGMLGQGGAGAAPGGPSVGPGVILSVLTGASSVVGLLFGYLILPVWAFYLLKDRVTLTAAFDRALPPSWRPDVWSTIRIVQRVFGQWIRGQLLLGVVVGVATFVGLLLLSQFVDPIFGRYALLLSVIAGVLELLPIIGPIIAAVPAVLLAATAGLEPVIAALVLYTLIQQLENYVLVPKIQGDAVELHPAAVMFAIVVGGALGGLLGAILALPMVSAGRDIVRYLFRRVGPNETPASATGALAGPAASTTGDPAPSERPSSPPDRATEDDKIDG